MSELHARHVRVIIVMENVEARFSHLATRGPGTENGTDDENPDGTNSGTPRGTENAPQCGQEERDKIGSGSNRSIAVSQDTLNESSDSSSDDETRYADRGASLQNETEKEDSLLHSTVNISSNFLVLGSFRFVKRIFQRVSFFVLDVNFNFILSRTNLHADLIYKEEAVLGKIGVKFLSANIGRVRRCRNIIKVHYFYF